MKTVKRIVIFAICVILLMVAPYVWVIFNSTSLEEKGNTDFNLADKDLLLVYTDRIAWESRNNITVKIYNNGKTEVFNYHNIVENYIIDEAGMNTIKKTIAKVNFMELDKDVSTDSCDGAYYSITVFADGENHTSEGLNPDNKRFCKLEDVILDVMEKQSGAKMLWDFSLDSDVAFYKEERKKVKTAGFKNTKPIEIKNKVEAIKRAKKEVTGKYNEIYVYFDSETSAWKISFYHTELGNDQTIYLSKDGITKLIVCGE